MVDLYAMKITINRSAKNSARRRRGRAKLNLIQNAKI